MHLNDWEKQVLDGKQGPAARMAMAILVEIGELFDACEMIAISSAHDDSVFYVGDAALEFAEHLAALGGRFAVPTSLSSTVIDLQRWQEYRVSKRLLGKIQRLEKAHLALGAAPTWSCAPYQAGVIPRFGEHIAWAESNATAFANSIIGARTNRYAGLLEICAAIIGRAPNFGLHLTENRIPQIRLRLRDISLEMLEDPAIYPLLGYILGEIAEDRVAVMEGIPPQVAIDSLKGFSAAAASSGAVALFHLVGVTPEAQTLEMCLQGRPIRSLETHTITPAMIRSAQQRLWSAEGNRVDLIALGCPHFSFMEFRELARLLAGRKTHPDVIAWVFTSRAVYGWIQNCGLLQTLQDAGLTVFTDGCPVVYPQESWNFQTVMTNSGKMANYCTAQRGLKVAYANLQTCVQTAVDGCIGRTKTLWN